MPRSDDLQLRWSGRWSLTSRILALNIFAIALLGGSFFWIDSFRVRLLDERLDQTLTEATIVATAFAGRPPGERASLAVTIGRRIGKRIRIYEADGDLMLDSFAEGPPGYVLRDPHAEPFRKDIARFLDRSIETVVRATPIPDHVEPVVDRVAAWPEAIAVREGSEGATRLTNAPDRTPIVSAAVPFGEGGVLLVTENARDVTGAVRDERLRLSIIFGAVVVLSVLLSLFLARTIVRPLRRLALAAHRVRLGRAREVVVPRLPSRRDEIGMLARALSDMSQALRQRIDAGEAFAADVAHELKNPLASLHSAVDSLARVDDPALQKQLLDVVRQDARRLDLLITEISEASRVDAELSRMRFERIDMGDLIGSIVAARDARNVDGAVRIAFARPRSGSAIVLGDDFRLARVIENMLDNAVSFSPQGGLVRVDATSDGEKVIISIDDEGPGVPPEQRDEIFHRFHSVRPGGEGFGQHSGLGLAIAKAIVEGHDGAIRVEDRDDSLFGARFVITLPMATE